MATALLLIVVFGILAGLWADGARARELATRLGQALCNRRGLQFLDGTVVLRRMGLRWTRAGLRFRRMFSFDYSREGSGRHTAWLILLGTEVEQVVLDEPEEPQPATPAPHEADSKVVPFRRPRKGP
ncbi:DUF3301 domain-containing protein [endosymbiont of unidentified scaly snail isolate Monju]|uniref:DUF3301 domain-containing protein n=1 Tax=endosymbiont of unidentified scaly snail isolate Monju TaxID=1248727 RepID=UPI0009DF96B5|nr:DUF3301 domain-containing protein [endosymbiont of unidentified scaly snail isolate Monju]